jgi:hypothetical protein
MIAALLKLFVFSHQPFVRLLQEATFLFQAYLTGRLDRVAREERKVTWDPTGTNEREAWRESRVCVSRCAFGSVNVSVGRPWGW